MTIPRLRVDGGAPPLRGRLFHLCQRVVSLGFQDEIPLPGGLESEDEVRLVIVHLAIVQVGDGEAEPGVLHEGAHRRMRVNEICRLLFPLARVRHDAVDV